MPRSLNETLDEPDIGLESKTTGLLTYVLRYEHLCAADSITLAPLLREGSRIDIGRATEPGPIAFDGHALRLPDPFASRMHARVVRHNNADTIEDCGSKLGTYVGGERIEGARTLKDGDCIEIGHSLFVYRLIDPKAMLLLSIHRGGMLHGPTRTLSPTLMSISADLEYVAGSNQPVLFVAETGAGKEIAARFVHEKSGRRGAFVAIDCGAIPEHLVEAELFGHKRGAFSGANSERTGRIRSADRGTIFLDEIGNMPPQAQASLLRVIQEGEVIPVGADQGQRVDVRWIAATNADIFSEKNAFRADLRARLTGYLARLPPLRERREDLGMLSAHILQNAGAPMSSMTRRAAHALFLGNFPANVRELQKALGTAALLANGGPIDLMHLSVWSAQSPSRESVPKALISQENESIAESRPRPYTRRPSLAEIEEALLQAKGVQSEAARRLGVHERQLRRWMDAYGIARTRQGFTKK